MDTSKRKTIKRLASITAAGTVLSLASTTLASSPDNVGNSDVDSGATLANIKLHTRMSAATNDIEIVITNTGKQTARITQMTPSQTNTKRGVFDFAKLMTNGDLVLEAGQSITVPMEQLPVALSSPIDLTNHASSLSSALRSSFSVITDNAAFARVDVASGIRLA